MQGLTFLRSPQPSQDICAGHCFGQETLVAVSIVHTVPRRPESELSHNSSSHRCWTSGSGSHMEPPIPLALCPWKTFLEHSLENLLYIFLNSLSFIPSGLWCVGPFRLKWPRLPHGNTAAPRGDNMCAFWGYSIATPVQLQVLPSHHMLQPFSCDAETDVEAPLALRGQILSELVALIEHSALEKHRTQLTLCFQQSCLLGKFQ